MNKIDTHISYLSSIDWSNEEYIPYDITTSMTGAQIIQHLQDYRYEIELYIN